MTDVPHPSLASLVKPLESLEAIVQSWDQSQRLTVQALRRAIEDLHKEALARMIRGIRPEPGASEVLKRIVCDEVVYAVLRHLELIVPSLNERIENALSSVRPVLQEHAGDVELVKIVPPDTIEIRLLGACDGCPASGVTLTDVIDKGIREYCPEITTIHKVKDSAPAANLNDPPVLIVNPSPRSSEATWRYVADLADIPESGIKVVDMGGESLLFSRQDYRVSCFQNACAHMGMPLDQGTISAGIITCPHHGFQYDLSSGECLTAPQVQLVPRAVSVVGSKVAVKLGSAPWA